MKYRKKPVIIDAEQWYPADFESHQPYKDRLGVYKNSESPTGYSIDTLEGSYQVTAGDWIITGIKGEKYPCKKDIFEMTYEQIQ